MLVLIVEDERDLAELMVDYLETEQMECDYAFDGAMAASLLAQNRYDAIVLDVTMPKLDGFSLAKQLQSQQLQSQQSNTPIIFVTARDTLDDKLTGFKLGAQDYLTKPFELDELVARLKVITQRPRPSQVSFKLDTLHMDFSAHRVKRGNRELALSPSQWQLLALLANDSPNVVSKGRIAQHIWPDQEANKDMLKTLVFRLRAIVDGEGEPALIHTVRGAGVALRQSKEQKDT